jgi:hypothetical protein
MRRSGIAAITLSLIVPSAVVARTAERLLANEGLVPVAEAPIACTGAAVMVAWESRTAPKVRVESNFSRHPSDVHFSGKTFTYQSKNGGEWGSELAVRRRGQESKVIYRGSDVLWLLPIEDVLYVFSGTQHLGRNSGSVHAVDRFDSAPSIRFVTLLPAAPVAVTSQGGTDWFIIASERAVMELRADRSLEVYTFNQFWFEQPTSAIFVDGDLIVGLCSGAAVVHIPWRTDAAPSREAIATVRYFSSRPNNKLQRTRGRGFGED